jgi:hypothetical protein
VFGGGRVVYTEFRDFLALTRIISLAARPTALPFLFAQHFGWNLAVYVLFGLIQKLVHWYLNLCDYRHHILLLVYA